MSDSNTGGASTLVGKTVKLLTDLTTRQHVFKRGEHLVVITARDNLVDLRDPVVHVGKEYIVRGVQRSKVEVVEVP